MPNHLHLLIYVNQSCKFINDVIGDSKRFLAYEIVKRLKEWTEVELLNILTAAVDPNERAKGKKHEVFRLSFDAKLIKDYDMLLEKVDYIHQNPLLSLVCFYRPFRPDKNYQRLTNSEPKH
jgi:hypothetical protein